MSIIARRHMRAHTWPTEIGFSTAAGRAIPNTLYGVTTEYVSGLTNLSAALSRHDRTTTVRIVFQDGTTAADYTASVANLRQHSYIFGQISDSTAMSTQTVAQYRARATSFVTTFQNNIDIYEIGNELNGEWVGASPAEINAKVQAAYDVVKKDFAPLNLRAAVTLNYWPNHDYYNFDWENTLTYAQQMPQEIREGIDYLFLSFYEKAGSPPVQPTNQDFINMFSSLMPLFPNAKVGMGEIGTLNGNETVTEKTSTANRYYGMHSAVKSGLGPRYVGGYFWWYYYQDCVPWDKAGSLWSLIDTNLSSY